MNRRYMLAVTLALFVAVTGCGTSAEDTTGLTTPGVTDEVVRVGMTTDLTGPAAFLGQELSAGTRLGFEHVNENGGVHGRRIELLVEDDGYQPPRTVAAYRKLLDRDGVFAFVGNLGTATNLALKPAIERDRVPIAPAISFSSTAYTPPSRYLFGIDPSYRMTAWIQVHHIAETLGQTDARIGVIYQDDDVGADALAGLRAAADHYGLEIVAEEGHRRGAIEFSSQVLNVREAGASHVVLWTLLRETAAILKKAEELDWAPQFLSWYVAADHRMVELAGSAAADLQLVSLVDFESDDARLRVYLDALDRYDSEHTPGFYHAGGFTMAQLFVEALTRAGRDLTREKLVDALETFDGWDDNAVGLPFTYGPGLRGGSVSKSFIAGVDIEQGKIVRLTEDMMFEMPMVQAAPTTN